MALPLPSQVIVLFSQVMILSLIGAGVLTRVAGNGPTKTLFLASPSIVLNSFPHNQLSRTCSDQVDRRYFEPSLDVPSLRSDIISVHTILSLCWKLGGMVRMWVAEKVATKARDQLPKVRMVE